MDTKALQNIGLTKNEITVYLTLLELGTTTTGPLTYKSGLHNSRVYESLNKLIEKGLASFIFKSGRKYFTASDPDILLDIVEEEKRAISDLLPQLQIMKKKIPSEEKAVVYEGYKGVRYVYDSIIRTLKKGDEILVFGARVADDNFMAKTYFKEYTKRRIAKGIKMKMLFNFDAKETGKFYSKLPNTEVKYTPKGMQTPAAIDIYGDNVGTLVLKKKPIVFLITSPEVAESYRGFFKQLWKITR